MLSIRKDSLLKRKARTSQKPKPTQTQADKLSNKVAPENNKTSIKDKEKDLVNWLLVRYRESREKLIELDISIDDVMKEFLSRPVTYVDLRAHAALLGLVDMSEENLEDRERFRKWWKNVVSAHSVAYELDKIDKRVKASILELRGSKNGL